MSRKITQRGCVPATKTSAKVVSSTLPKVAVDVGCGAGRDVLFLLEHGYTVHAYDKGCYRGKQAMLSVTSGSPEKAFQPFGRAGNMVHWLWPMHASLYYVGFDVLAPQLSYGIQGGGIRYQEEAALIDHLETCKVAWASRLRDLDSELPIPFTGWDDWDTDGVLLQTSPLRWRLG